MENHRTATTYSDAFREYLAHTDEKPVLLGVVSQRLRVLGTTSLLDIGAGNGDLSIPLAKHVKHYIAVEQKQDYVTFEDEESEWNDLVVASGLEEVRQRESRLQPLRDYLKTFGTVQHEVITTHVRTKTLGEILQALAFVWSDGRADHLQAFLQNQKIAEQLETKYRDGDAYSFSFHHYLLDIHR